MIRSASPSSTQSTSHKAPPRRPSGAVQPGVAVHRMFPALCGLWFAALFGLGCVVASADALGSLVVHLHLPSILAAAAPPLGHTARLVLSLLLAGVGGAIGLVLGVVLQKRAKGAVPAQRQATAQELETATAPAAVDTSAPRVRSRDAHPDAPPRRPLVVTEDVLPYPTSVGEPAAERPYVSTPVSAPVVFEQSDAVRATPLDDFDDDDLEPSPFLAAAQTSASRGEVPIVVAPAEPVILPTLAEHEQIEAVEDHVVAEPAAPIPVASPPPLASQAAAAPHVPLDAVPVGSLGLVQLIERLALAIATRQSRRAAEPAVVPPADAVDPRMPLHRFDPLTMDPPGPLLRTKPSKAQAVPEPEADEDAEPVLHIGQTAHLHDPLASVEDWSDEDFDDVLPPRHLGQAVVEAHTLTAGAVENHDHSAEDDSAEDDSADDDVAEQRYSSLTDMTLRRPELVPSDFAEIARVNEAPHGDAELEVLDVADPVVRFPSRLAGDGTMARPETVSDEADRALRDALATLRRMSGQR